MDEPWLVFTRETLMGANYTHDKLLCSDIFIKIGITGDLKLEM